ncbi:MAG: hypothetical protein ABI480_18410 [Chitinophagaceae bacterium]
MCKKHFHLLLLTATLFIASIQVVSAQGNFNLKYTNSAVYAGIEVGSKGVKLSIIEMGKNMQNFNALKDSSINTDFISFTDPTFTATLNGLYHLYMTATSDYKIPAADVYTVVSSGVKQQAEKENKITWISNLIDSFKLRIKEPKRNVEVVDVAGEARLSHLGIVPEDKRYNTFLIDIGSGNAKGGYFPYGNDSNFKLFQLNWGTKSTTNETDKRCGDDKTLLNFNRQLYKVLLMAENNEIIYSVNASGAYPVSDNIAFSGGIAWSVATLIHPELNDKSVITVTFDDVSKFSDILYKNYAALSPEALAAAAVAKDKSVDKSAVAKEVKRVETVFDQRSLMAGTGLLLKIMRQFISIYESKQFYLVKNGQVGWISAYVGQTVKK